MEKMGAVRFKRFWLINIDIRWFLIIADIAGDRTSKTLTEVNVPL